jgi:hypothetical protein
MIKIAQILQYKIIVIMAADVPEIRLRKTTSYCDNKYVGLNMHACMHTYIHTYIRTYVHTHTHTYIHTYIRGSIGK